MGDEVVRIRSICYPTHRTNVLLQLDDCGVQFVGGGKASIVSKFQRIFRIDKVRIWVRSLNGSIYWGTLMENYFVEDQTSESLKIPKIPIIYWNDPFLRVRKRLGNHVELKKASGAEGMVGSLPTLTEVIAVREAAEKM